MTEAVDYVARVRHFDALRECRLSGQMSEAQWRDHLASETGLPEWCAIAAAWDTVNDALFALSEWAARGQQISAAQLDAVIAAADMLDRAKPQPEAAP